MIDMVKRARPPEPAESRERDPIRARRRVARRRGQLNPQARKIERLLFVFAVVLESGPMLGIGVFWVTDRTGRAGLPGEEG